MQPIYYPCAENSNTNNNRVKTFPKDKTYGKFQSSKTSPRNLVIYDHLILETASCIARAT